MKEPLVARKNLLHELLTPTEFAQPCEFIEQDGKAFYQATCDLGLEGIVAKRKDGIYSPGRRSDAWQKIKRVRDSDFVIAGYTLGGKRKEYFSSLILGLYDRNQRLKYVGQVGTGFSDREAKSLFSQLQELHIENSPFQAPLNIQRLTYWCRPELVCQVEYGEFTLDGKLRYPIYKNLREEKSPLDCLIADASAWPKALAAFA